MTEPVTHILSHHARGQIVVSLFYGSGSLCPDCGYGTRVTSKRWCACKRCDRTRIPRRSMEDCASAIRKASVEVPARRTDEGAV